MTKMSVNAPHRQSRLTHIERRRCPLPTEPRFLYLSTTEASLELRIENLYLHCRQRNPSPTLWPAASPCSGATSSPHIHLFAYMCNAKTLRRQARDAQPIKTAELHRTSPHDGRRSAGTTVRRSEVWQTMRESQHIQSHTNASSI